MSAVTEDGLVILLDRIQALAIDAHKAMRVIGLETKVRDQANDLARLHSDFAAAEKKIYEWAEYAGSLRGAIDASGKPIPSTGTRRDAANSARASTANANFHPVPMHCSHDEGKPINVADQRVVRAAGPLLLLSINQHPGGH